MAKTPGVLREQWQRALERGNNRDALAALEELEVLEPEDACWSQRIGDTLRRLDRRPEAEAAYERAMRRFAAQGMLPRAVAMAKTIETLNPRRLGIAAQIDQAAARALQAHDPRVHPPTRPSALPPSWDASPLGRSLRAAPPLVPATSDDDDGIVVFEDAALGSTAASELGEHDLREAWPTLGGAADGHERPSSAQLSKMAGTRLFARLQPAALALLTQAAELVTVPAGELVCCRGEPSDALLVIVEGEADVFVESSVAVGSVGEGEILGESCLLSGGVRQADVRARLPVTALRIGKHAIETASVRYPEIFDQLFWLLTRHLVGDVMRSSALFRRLDGASRHELGRLFEARLAPTGTVLATAGKPSDAFYITLIGRFQLESPDVPPAALPAHSAFGYVSLLTEGPEPCTVRALDDGVVLRLPAARFGRFAVMCFRLLLEQKP